MHLMLSNKYGINLPAFPIWKYLIKNILKIIVYNFEKSHYYSKSCLYNWSHSLCYLYCSSILADPLYDFLWSSLFPVIKTKNVTNRHFNTFIPMLVIWVILKLICREILTSFLRKKKSIVCFCSVIKAINLNRSDLSI